MTSQNSRRVSTVVRSSRSAAARRQIRQIAHRQLLLEVLEQRAMLSGTPTQVSDDRPHFGFDTSCLVFGQCDGFDPRDILLGINESNLGKMGETTALPPALQSPVGEFLFSASDTNGLEIPGDSVFSPGTLTVEGITPFDASGFVVSTTPGSVDTVFADIDGAKIEAKPLPDGMAYFHFAGLPIPPADSVEIPIVVDLADGFSGEVAFEIESVTATNGREITRSSAVSTTFTVDGDFSIPPVVMDITTNPTVSTGDGTLVGSFLIQSSPVLTVDGYLVAPEIENMTFSVEGPVTGIHLVTEHGAEIGIVREVDGMEIVDFTGDSYHGWPRATELVRISVDAPVGSEVSVEFVGMGVQTLAEAAGTLVLPVSGLAEPGIVLGDDAPAFPDVLVSSDSRFIWFGEEIPSGTSVHVISAGLNALGTEIEGVSGFVFSTNNPDAVKGVDVFFYDYRQGRYAVNAGTAESLGNGKILVQADGVYATPGRVGTEIHVNLISTPDALGEMWLQLDEVILSDGTARNAWGENVRSNVVTFSGVASPGMVTITNVLGPDMAVVGEPGLIFETVVTVTGEAQDLPWFDAKVEGDVLQFDDLQFVIDGIVVPARFEWLNETIVEVFPGSVEIPEGIHTFGFMGTPMNSGNFRIMPLGSTKFVGIESGYVNVESVGTPLEFDLPGMTYVVPSADISVAFSDITPPTISVGVPTPFEIVISNAGPSTAGNVDIISGLSEELFIFSSEMTIPFVYDEGILRVSINDLHAGTQESLRFTLTLREGLGFPSGQHFFIAAQAAIVDPDPDPLNNIGGIGFRLDGGEGEGPDLWPTLVDDFFSKH